MKIIAQETQLLIGALARLDNGAAWIRGTEARSEDDDNRDALDHDATKWCATGSMRREIYEQALANGQWPEEADQRAWWLLNMEAVHLIEALHGKDAIEDAIEEPVPTLNDNHTWEIVQQMFEGAIRASLSPSSSSSSSSSSPVEEEVHP